MFRAYLETVDAHTPSSRRGEDAEPEIFETAKLVHEYLMTGDAGPVAAVVASAVDILIENDFVAEIVHEDVDMVRFGAVDERDEDGNEYEVPAILYPPDYHVQVAESPVTALSEYSSILELVRYYMTGGQTLSSNPDRQEDWEMATDERIFAMSADTLQAVISTAEEEGVHITLDEADFAILKDYPRGFRDLSSLVTKANVDVVKVPDGSVDALRAIGKLEAITCFSASTPEHFLMGVAEVLSTRKLKSPYDIEMYLRGVDSAAFLFARPPKEGERPQNPATGQAAVMTVIPVLERPDSYLTPHDVIRERGRTLEHMRGELLWAGIAYR